MMGTRDLGRCVVFVALLSCKAQLCTAAITSYGAVTALTNVSQLAGIVGIADFDEGPTSGSVPIGQYTAQGMTLQVGALSSILSGVTTSGIAFQPSYGPHDTSLFPALIAGGGIHVNQFAYTAIAATFNSSVTQIGLTASRNGNQFITVWDQSGTMLGQVNWVPQVGMLSSFIGIDTNGVPIGMVTYGNDDVWNGETFIASGATTIFDTMMWASGTGDAVVPEPASIFIWSLLGLAIGAADRRRRRTLAFPYFKGNDCN